MRSQFAVLLIELLQNYTSIGTIVLNLLIVVVCFALWFLIATQGSKLLINYFFKPVWEKLTEDNGPNQYEENERLYTEYLLWVANNGHEILFLKNEL